MAVATGLESTRTIKDYVRVLRARKRLLLIVPVVTLTGVMILTALQEPMYQATARLLIRGIDNVVGTEAENAALAPGTMETERELVTSRPVAGEVARRLRLSMPLDTLLSNVDVEVVPNTNLLAISYNSPDPTRAAAVANAFALAYVDSRRRQAVEQLNRAARSVESEISSLETKPPGLARNLLPLLQERLAELQLAAATVQGSQVVEAADRPSQATTPDMVRNGLLGLLAGLVLGAALAFVLEAIHDKVRSHEELAQRLGTPLIGAIPTSGRARRRDPQALVALDASNPTSGAYHALAANVQRLAIRRAMKVIMVTSPVGGEGKTTVSANLGVALAQAGNRVIIVSADLRIPRIHLFFSLSNDIGLANVLSDGTSPSHVIQDSAIENLKIVTAGPAPANPVSLFRGNQADEFFNSLRSLADFVIMDTPPLLAVDDPGILASRADGVVLVIDGGAPPNRSALEEMRRQLNDLDVAILGLVYNRAPLSDSSLPYQEEYYRRYAKARA